MADVIQTDNSGTGIIVGILIAVAIAVVAYFALAERDSGPELQVDLPNASATVNTQ